MIVCQCRVVSSGQIREAIAEGAGDVCSLAEACGAGRACGNCLPVVRSLLERSGLPTDEQLDARGIRAALQARRCGTSPVAASA